jgi:ribulose-5-phosphate 4-epimerase/fuculose-1-phosphate aldolase
MTNVDALKNLYVALGGSADDVADITLTADMIAKIATIAPSAGVELPTVTTENNGQVLTVVQGKWAAAALPE